ncbi:hypothetical protein PoB_002109600 [Plakobranchus ocellatus]|uniref:Uncharacterized protein n=1 Tax=Plakobranchus ocellatus TaxID=259542 RepID=A0AAV3ZFC3_9GAST|nr:hypothetical protein PoB_002109600 [Plakobranchus ocellatus]
MICAMEEIDEVFETFDDVVAELWSSPLMNHKSPFDDYKDLYAGYERPTRIPVPITPTSPATPYEKKRFSKPSLMIPFHNFLNYLLTLYVRPLSSEAFDPTGRVWAAFGDLSRRPRSVECQAIAASPPQSKHNIIMHGPVVLPVYINIDMLPRPVSVSYCSAIAEYVGIPMNGLDRAATESSGCKRRSTAQT